MEKNILEPQIKPAIKTEIKTEIKKEIEKRRTFAIISHPDAGKTTLTEKLLLYAGMIRTAGMVHGRKNQKKASSDWMEMEQERGISITASAMQFNYKSHIINVLDTPGHQDFSEDTYRTLTAADSAVMVIDASKGVETQTRKLFKVCMMRNIPILTFINKMDLPAKCSLELLSEIEEVLGIKTTPINWPIGKGKNFKGVYHLEKDKVYIYEKSIEGGSAKKANETIFDAETYFKNILNDTELKNNALEEIELVKVAGEPFTKDNFLKGKITPVFFGSALTNFGVEFFFDHFLTLAPSPRAREALNIKNEEIFIDPINEPFSGNVFKIQANMDPKHRDSMAFLRVNSGRFERDMVVKHSRLKRELKLSRSHNMFGRDRATLDYAYPGDIIGVVNPGVFSIGDTISINGNFTFKPMPKFPPEIVARIRAKDAMKRKAFEKGIKQFTAEGAVLILTTFDSSISNDPLIAAVGILQFEVLQSRFLNEYNVKTDIDILQYKHGAWLKGDPSTFSLPTNSIIAYDINKNYIFLYTESWQKEYALEKNPNHKLVDFSDS
ncbi:MAG: peptide chain release factor 3 [Bdellovibrionota bacterium]